MINIILTASADETESYQWSWHIRANDRTALRSTQLGMLGFATAEAARQHALETIERISHNGRQHLCDRRADGADRETRPRKPR